jgi:DNA-binding Lrp family transcriptional regulator
MEQAGRETDGKEEAALDALDRRILGIIQSAFPLEPRPYAVIGGEIGLTEAEVFERVRRLKATKIIRRLGANFQSAGLGFHSTLCAAKVPEKELDAFAAEVRRHVGVTHNYLRNHEYNVWFTCIGPSREAVSSLIEEISRKTGIAVLNLPAKRLYKIKVDFQME